MNTFSDKFQKILRLIKKTGDRVIVFDSMTSEDVYVLMDLDSYTDLVEEVSEFPAITSKEDTQKTSEENKTILNLDAKSISNEEKNKQINSLTEEDLTDKINREISVWKNQENSTYLSDEIKSKRPWTIPPQVKDKAQNIE